MRAFYSSLADSIERYFRVDAHYFLRGGFWLSLGQGVTIFFGIISTALFAHFLTEANYGIYKYLIGLAGLFASISLTGLAQSILQTAAKQYDGFYQQTFGINFLYSLCIAAVSLAASGYYFLNENLILASGCFLIAVLQPLINTFGFTQALLQGSRRFRESTALHTLRTFSVTALSIGTLYLTQDIILLFAVYLGGQLITNYLSHLLYQPTAKTVPSDIFNKYLQYAKHTSIRNLIATISNRADTILVFTQLGAVELAIYSIATIVPEQIKGSFKNLASLLLPKYAQHTDTTKLIQSVPKRSLQLFFMLATITIVYILVAPYIYSLLFPKYPDAALYSQLAALSFPTFILFIPYTILQSQLNEDKLYKLTIYSSIIQIIITSAAIIGLGLIGAIIGRIVYRLVFMTITYYYLYKKSYV